MYIWIMDFISIDKTSRTPIYKQIITCIENTIAQHKLKKGDQLPSINAIKDQYQLSRDTVLSAFNDLKSRGIIDAVAGKGYFINNENIQISKRIFVLFDELNAFKEDLYNSLVQSLDENTEVDIFFHHFNIDVFHQLILNHTGKYNQYIIMPANLEHSYSSIKNLPSDQVYILDQMQNSLIHFPGVFQNFEKDMIENLNKLTHKIQKYNQINLWFDSKKQPKGILKGFKTYCHQHHFNHTIIIDSEEIESLKNKVYITLDDNDLIKILKLGKEKNLNPGTDYGIISYNDSLLKEFVEGGITTISTDFKAMGKYLADMIQQNESNQIENNNLLKIRKSI